MINVNELRIGNWINANPEVHKHLTEETLAHQVDARLIFDMTDDPMVQEHHNPIPLDAKWFKKFVFKRVEMMFENEPMNYWRNDKIIIYNELENLVCGLYNDKEVSIPVIVDYVHQLQNLHFALFGTEMQYTQAGGV